MKIAIRTAAALAATGMLVLSACSSKDTSLKNATTAADSGRAIKAPPTGETSGMRGMQMGGMMSSAMTDSMQSHMRMMDGVTGDQMKAMLPAHRQMVNNMLSEMNVVMRRMNMSSDAKWTALTDSVRQDLTRMPDMSSTQLKSFMPEHAARVMRLMDMHRSMMGGTKM
jgi:hypothetical protein